MRRSRNQEEEVGAVRSGGTGLAAGALSFLLMLAFLAGCIALDRLKPDWSGLVSILLVFIPLGAFGLGSILLAIWSVYKSLVTIRGGGGVRPGGWRAVTGIALSVVAVIGFVSFIGIFGPDFKIETPVREESFRGQEYVWKSQFFDGTSFIPSMSAAGPNAAWAVDGGNLLFFDGGGWDYQYVEERQLDRASAYTFTAVDAFDENNAWAVGTNNTVFRFDGEEWRQETVPEAPVPGNDLFSVAAADPQHVWAVGERGVLFFDGRRWTVEDGLSGGFECVSATSPSDAWVVGVDRCMHYDGDGWTEVPTGLEGGLRDVFALDETHVWASTADGRVGLFDGEGWQLQLECGKPIDDLFALDPENAWVVGTEIEDDEASESWYMYAFDGSNWKAEFVADPSGGLLELNGIYSVTAADLEHVWIGGDCGIYSGERR